MAWSSFWQLYHSLPSYTWFTPLWSSFLCWQSLKKSYQQTDHNFCSMRWLEILSDNFTILTPFFTHVYWMNEALTQGFGSIACSDQKRSAAYLGALPAKESVCVTQPFQSQKTVWTPIRSKSVIYIAMKASILLCRIWFLGRIC